MAEDRDRVRGRVEEEDGMNKAEQERQEVGLSPEEVREINKLKPRKGLTRRDLVKRAVNLAAAGATLGGGVGIAAVVEGALNNSPPPRVSEAKPDSKRDLPPSSPGLKVQFPQDVRSAPQPDAPVVEAPPPDAPVEPVYTNRVLLPNITREYKTPEPPLYLREFGAPERGVIMRNKVEQGGGNPARVEMGDQELFENMMYLRETYGRPDLKLEITFYSSADLFRRTPVPIIPPHDPNMSGPILWDNWAGGNGTFEEYGIQRYRYREADKTLEWHASLPTPKPGKIPTEDEVNRIHIGFLDMMMRSVFWADENARTTVPIIRPGSPEANDLRNYPDLVFENRRVVKSALWVKLETIPTTGGK